MATDLQPQGKPNLVLVSTRIEASVNEELRSIAFELRRTKQELFQEALALFIEKYGEVSPAADSSNL